MKINLKNNIWIEGIIQDGITRLLPTGVEYIYQGKTSEIPEKLVCRLVKSIPNKHSDYNLYLNYKNNSYIFGSAKESIKSACSEEYCVIYKTKIIYENKIHFRTSIIRSVSSTNT